MLWRTIHLLRDAAIGAISLKPAINQRGDGPMRRVLFTAILALTFSLNAHATLPNDPNDLIDLCLTRMHKAVEAITLIHIPSADIDNITFGEATDEQKALLPRSYEMHPFRYAVAKENSSMGRTILKGQITFSVDNCVIKSVTVERISKEYNNR